MNRRQLLKTMSNAAAGALVLNASKGFALPFSDKTSRFAANDNQLAFAGALADNDKLIAFANVEQNFSPTQLTIEGNLPKDLHGTFYRNGPAKHERANIRYQHLFEGDGMIQQYKIADGKIHHQGKFVNSAKFQQEEKAQRFIYPGPDTQVPNALSVLSPDTINTANTSIISVGDDLWALWEAGSATKVDANTLTTKGLVSLGQGSNYGEQLNGLPFSAHPKQEANGDIWNFGFIPNGQVVLYHLNKNGITKNVKLINSRYQGRMLHDFLITSKHILLILPSLKHNGDQEHLFGGISFDKTQPMRVLIIDKQTLSIMKEVELPPAFVFHFGNAWERNDGTIHFDASLYNNVDILHHLANVMRGEQLEKPKDMMATPVLFTIKPNGSVEQHAFAGSSEFPKVHDHLVGLRNQHLFYISSQADSLWNDTVTRLNTETGKQESYFYGNDFLIEEHVNICPQQKAGTGYLIGTALHVPSKRTCLNVFKEDRITDGPIARAWLSHHLPLGFHGHFVAS
ncbi:hypothetical protein tinsulaeT_32390 [Thalassotalea insulae]|uniref:Dioxygenase n=1 Tax=Thalassotalea insulae TaxID=2056778 RepID=A0ABQ6GXI2_9GAMM|nr:carotenoid oxygenase family protein [Thalassotalea insulae]GLX79899.1 hypothetical protein tinsulaeT_32390 [Thalassotalea insulae]